MNKFQYVYIISMGIFGWFVCESVEGAVVSDEHDNHWVVDINDLRKAEGV